MSDTAEASSDGVDVWAERIGTLYKFALEITGDRQAAVKWMHTPNQRFDGLAPIVYAISDEGACELETRLGRLAYGIVA